MDRALELLINAGPTMVLALAGLLGTAGYVSKKIGEAIATAIREWSKARATKVVAEAEAEKAEKETTGRFLTLAANDQNQLREFYNETREALKKCDEERKADQQAHRAEIAELRERIAALEEKNTELENSRDALWEELKKWHKAEQSGGAYPHPHQEVKK